MPADSRSRDKGPFVWDLPVDSITAKPIVDLYLRYHRADAVASAYAELQRSVQIVIALLGVATVAFAAASTLSARHSTLFAFLELFSLSIALYYVFISHRQAWQDRWLDCRLLAEILRYSRFLVLTGMASPFADLRAPAAEYGRRTWARDHALGVLRAQPLSVPGRTTAEVKEAVGQTSHYIAEQCIESQVRYHRKTGYLHLKYDKVLRRFSLVASIATLALVLAKLCWEFFYSQYTKPLWPAVERSGEVLTFLAIVLPAFTAGLLAVRAFGEHDVVGRRSLTMMKALERDKHVVEGASDMQALGDHMLRVARSLLHDVDGWRELYSEKHLES